MPVPIFDCFVDSVFDIRSIRERRAVIEVFLLVSLEDVFPANITFIVVVYGYQLPPVFMSFLVLSIVC